MKIAIICMFAAQTVFAAQTFAQLPDEPRPVKIFDAALDVANFTIHGLDAYSTYQAVNDPCHCYTEGNPLAPSGNSATTTFAYQEGIAAAFINVHRLTERNPRAWVRWAGRAFIIAGTAGEVVTVIHNDTRK
jgi:hypothetical protein